MGKLGVCGGGVRLCCCCPCGVGVQEGICAPRDPDPHGCSGGGRKPAQPGDSQARLWPCCRAGAPAPLCCVGWFGGRGAVLQMWGGLRPCGGLGPQEMGVCGQWGVWGQALWGRGVEQPYGTPCVAHRVQIRIRAHCSGCDTESQPHHRLHHAGPILHRSPAGSAVCGAVWGARSCAEHSAMGVMALPVGLRPPRWHSRGHRGTAPRTPGTFLRRLSLGSPHRWHHSSCGVPSLSLLHRSWWPWRALLLAWLSLGCGIGTTQVRVGGTGLL